MSQRSDIAHLEPLSRDSQNYVSDPHLD